MSKTSQTTYSVPKISYVINGNPPFQTLSPLASPGHGPKGQLASLQVRAPSVAQVGRSEAGGILHAAQALGCLGSWEHGTSFYTHRPIGNLRSSQPKDPKGSMEPTKLARKQWKALVWNPSLPKMRLPSNDGTQSQQNNVCTISGHPT